MFQRQKKYLRWVEILRKKLFSEISYAVGSWEVFVDSYWCLDFEVLWIFKASESGTLSQTICVTCFLWIGAPYPPSPQAPPRSLLLASLSGFS